MDLGLWALCRYSKQVAGGRSLGSWVLRWRYVRFALRHRQAVARLLQSAESATFCARAAQNPELMGFFLWPFLNAAWGVERRFDCLVRHHNLVAQRFPWLRLGYKQALPVLDLGDLYPGLGFVIEDAPWFVREGCVNFSMMCGGERLMSVSFTLNEHDGGVDALVGSIQGSARDTVLETYKSIARAMQQTRPRDLHFKVFRLLLQSLGVSRVLCVADDHRAHNDPFFGSSEEEKIKLRYDELWQDQGGVPDGAGFYVMPAVVEDRPLSDVPTKKRGRYKRRLKMFSEIWERLEQGVARHGHKPLSPAPVANEAATAATEEAGGAATQS